jgi:cytochrome oxidase Cu insertion factor (SCO1/SenC/PrrC family)
MRWIRAQWPLLAVSGIFIALLVGVWMTYRAIEHRSMPARLTAAESNQDVDPGSPAGNVPAPDFKLHDQQDRLTTLAQFRGKVVVLTFVDSQCTTICPLMTESMVRALDLLGQAAGQVQLLGINANPLAMQISDVAAYTRVHQMQGRWRFLTGSLPQLKRVWSDYHVYVAAIHNDIDHQPVIVLIDPRGRERTIYLTQLSYEGVDQQAQVLAEGIARLLPGHVVVRQAVSLRQIPPLRPTDAVQLPAVGASQQEIILGGPHGRLYLFFAGWLGEESELRQKLVALDEYATTAHQQGWPPPVAIDELPTEPSATTARSLLTRLAATLHVPIIEDEHGRLAEGYGVQDLPWFVLTSRSGKILWHHDGWLSSTDLGQQVRVALAGH